MMLSFPLCWGGLRTLTLNALLVTQMLQEIERNYEPKSLFSESFHSCLRDQINFLNENKSYLLSSVKMDVAKSCGENISKDIS